MKKRLTLYLAASCLGLVQPSIAGNTYSYQLSDGLVVAMDVHATIGSELWGVLPKSHFFNN